MNNARKRVFRWSFLLAGCMAIAPLPALAIDAPGVDLPGLENLNSPEIDNRDFPVLPVDLLEIDLHIEASCEAIDAYGDIAEGDIGGFQLVSSGAPSDELKGLTDGTVIFVAGDSADRIPQMSCSYTSVR